MNIKEYLLMILYDSNKKHYTLLSYNRNFKAINRKSKKGINYNINIQIENNIKSLIIKYSHFNINSKNDKNKEIVYNIFYFI